MIVQDPTLLHQVDLFAGLGADGYLLVNTGADASTSSGSTSSSHGSGRSGC